MRKEENPSRGFSLIELLLVVVLFSVLAAVAIPRFAGVMSGRTATTSAARELASDLRLCRTLAVSNAGTNQSGYSLRMDNGNPCPGYRIVNRLTQETVSTKSFSGTVTRSGNKVFKFGPLGNLISGSGTSLTLSSDDHACTLTLSAANGSVTIEETP